MDPILSNVTRPEVMKLAALHYLLKEAAADPKLLANMSAAVKKMKGAVSTLPAKPKIASVGSHAVEVAGLGILARPSLRHMKGKEQTEKSTQRHEVAGLGLLAAPSAGHLGSAALKKVNPNLHGRIAATKAGKFLSKFAAVSASRKRDPMRQPYVSDDADWAQRTNLVSVQGGSDSSRVTQAASVMKTAASNGFGQFAGRAAHLAEKAMKPAGQVAATAVKAPEPAKKKLTMDMIMAAKKRMASGGHGGIY